MNLPPFLPPTCSKCTFDMFNFLASQHRVLPEGATCDEEEDEVQLRSTRYGGQAGVLGVVWKGPKESNRGKRSHFSVPAYVTLPSPTRRATSLELPMAMRFRHLKKTSKEAVGVYRFVGLWGGCPLSGQAGALVRGCLGSVPLTSPLPILPCRSAIHGRGLFCKRNIDAGEMVIEYSGIVIRSVLTDKREKFYDGKVGSARPWE